MININYEINKLKKFNSNQEKIFKKFFLFIGVEDLSFSIHEEIDVVVEKTVETSFKFPCKRKNLLRFIHPDRISELNLEIEEENKLNECTVKIISNSFNIIQSLELIKETLNQDSFMLICNKLRLSKENIDKIICNSDDTLPNIPELLKKYVELERETVPLKLRINNIINNISMNIKTKIYELWIDIYTKYYKYLNILSSKNETSQMEREDYYIQYQIFSYYENNNKTITYFELITMLGKSSIIEKFNLLKVNAPYLFDYIKDLTINSYLYDQSIIETIAGLEFNRFKNSLV